MDPRYGGFLMAGVPKSSKSLGFFGIEMHVFLEEHPICLAMPGGKGMFGING
jgi:hypothetical protein